MGHVLGVEDKNSIPIPIKTFRGFSIVPCGNKSLETLPFLLINSNYSIPPSYYYMNHQSSLKSFTIQLNPKIQKSIQLNSFVIQLKHKCICSYQLKNIYVVLSGRVKNGDHNTIYVSYPNGDFKRGGLDFYRNSRNQQLINYNKEPQEDRCKSVT